MSYRKTETAELLKIIENYAQIVNNRKNDVPTAVNKRKAWIRITNEYNRLPNVRPRLVKQVKKFYENSKSRKTKTEPLTNDVASAHPEGCDGDQNVQDDSNESCLSLNEGSTHSEPSTEMHLLKTGELSRHPLQITHLWKLNVDFSSVVWKCSHRRIGRQNGREQMSSTQTAPNECSEGTVANQNVRAGNREEGQSAFASNSTRSRSWYSIHNFLPSTSEFSPHCVNCSCTRCGKSTKENCISGRCDNKTNYTKRDSMKSRTAIHILFSFQNQDSCK